MAKELLLSEDGEQIFQRIIEKNSMKSLINSQLVYFRSFIFRKQFKFGFLKKPFSHTGLITSNVSLISHSFGC